MACHAVSLPQRVNRKAMSSMLQSTLEAVVDVDKFPKASVDVNVLVLQVWWDANKHGHSFRRCCRCMKAE
jgi:hypothetical protein